MAKESIYFSVPDMSGNRDPKQIKRELGRYPGVLSVSVNSRDRVVAVDFDNTGISGPEIERHLGKIEGGAHTIRQEEHKM